MRLVDAHSFCWILSTLLKQEAEGTIAPTAGSAGQGRIIGGREKSILAMRYSVEHTVRNSNGQVVQRILKNKELRMSSTSSSRRFLSFKKTAARSQASASTSTAAKPTGICSPHLTASTATDTTRRAISKSSASL